MEMQGREEGDDNASTVAALLAEVEALLLEIGADNDGDEDNDAATTTTSASSSDPESVPATTPSTKTQTTINSTRQKKPKAKRSRNSTRDREKAEAAFLRKCVSQLEADVAAWSERRRSPTSPSSTASATTAIVAAAWEKTAARHAAMRHAAEKENRHLRGLVDSNDRFIAALWRTVQQRASVGGLVRARRVLQSRDDASGVIARLKHAAQAAYSQTHDVLAMSGLTETSLDQYNRTHSIDGAVAITCAQTLPFSTERVAGAVWNTMKTWLTPACADPQIVLSSSMYAIEFKPVEMSESVCAGRGQCTLTIEHVDVSITYHGVFQRYVEDNGRSVFVWQILLSAHPCDDLLSDRHCEVSAVSWVAVDRIGGTYAASRMSNVTRISASGLDDSDTAFLSDKTGHNQIVDGLIQANEVCLNELAEHIDRALLQVA
ncbi:hypothetical protein FI667_g17543, partial [Globisporangium splendens]